MKARHFINKLLATCCNLFNFKRPQFTQLDFIDLVIDDKPIFLLTWQSSNAHSLIIQSICKYRLSQGSIIVQIPASLDHLTLRLKNTWRSTRLDVTILHTRLDQKTASMLLKQIRRVKSNGELIWETPLSALVFHNTQLTIPKTITGTKRTRPAINKPQLNIKSVYPFISKQPVLQSQKITYTQKTH